MARLDNVINEHLQSLLYDTDGGEAASLVDDSSSVKTKNSRTNDGRFATYAQAVLKKKEVKAIAPTEEIRVEFDIPERPLSPLNDRIRAKMTELLGSFSIKPIANVLHRLGIRMMDIGNEQECLALRAMLVQCLRFHSNESINSARWNETFFSCQTDAERILRVAHEHFDANRQKLTDNRIEQIRALELARRIVLTSDIDVFLGRMMVYAPTRGGKIFDTVLSLLLDRSQKEAPLLAEKVTVIFTGCYKEHRDADKEFPALSQWRRLVSRPIDSQSSTRGARRWPMGSTGPNDERPILWACVPSLRRTESTWFPQFSSQSETIRTLE